MKAEALAEDERGTAEATPPRRTRAKALVEAEAFGWTPDPSAAEALGACLGEHKLGRARRGEDGAWAAWHNNDRDTCVAAWATAHLTETRIDRLAVIRKE